MKSVSRLPSVASTQIYNEVYYGTVYSKHLLLKDTVDDRHSVRERPHRQLVNDSQEDKIIE